MTANPQIQHFDFSNRELYNPAYIPLFRNKAEFLHLFGSAGSGKSRFEAQKEIVRSFRSERRGRKTLCIRKVFNTIKDSLYAELKTVLYEWKLEDCFEILKSPLQIRNTVTDVTFLFIGLDDVEKVKSISGVDRIWIEEATELETKSELDQLRLRLRGFDEVQITLSYNPINEHHWLNTEIHQGHPDGHFIFKSTYRDNIKMLAKDPHYAPSIEALATSNPNYYQVYGLGNWGRVLEGLIYESYETIPTFPQKSANCDDIQFYGLDFGYSDPTALVGLHVQDALPKKNLICKEILYESGLDAIGLIAKFDSLKIRKDVKITADNARPEMISALVKAGYRVTACEKSAGSVLSGINRVRKYMIQIAAGSKNIIKEISNYQKRNIHGVWTEEPELHQVDHALDAIRYGEQTQDKTQWKQSEFRI